MRGLTRGESYRITNGGALVGVLSPAERSTLDDATLRAGDQVMDFPDGVVISQRVGEALRELRGDR